MSTTVGSAKANRTRRDLVDAAIERWSSDNTAALGEVAQQAGVGRTTLNRYFSDRAQLVAAVDVECRHRYAAAVARARPGEGTGLAALLRLCTEVMRLGPVLGLIFADNALVDANTWYDDDSDPLGVILARGYEDGSLAADLPPTWVGALVWTSLFAAWLVVRSEELTWHESAQLLTRTLGSGIAAPSLTGARHGGGYAEAPV